MQTLRDTSSSATAPPRLWLRVALVGAVLVAFATGLLWARFGTVVFHEILAAGIAVCF